MKLRWPFILTIAGMVMALAGASYFVAAANGDAHLEKLEIAGKGGVTRSFEVEIAATPVDMEIGLMFRKSMEPDHGMLFELGRTDVTRFWMKNTLIPLDMLFIAPDGTIKTIHENAEPQSLEGISSEVPVSGVLELNGGRARALGIVAGDKVIHPYFSTP